MMVSPEYLIYYWLPRRSWLLDTRLEETCEETLIKELDNFKCQNCDEVFGDTLELGHHMNACHHIKMCIHCGKQFPNW